MKELGALQRNTFHLRWDVGTAPQLLQSRLRRSSLGHRRSHLHYCRGTTFRRVAAAVIGTVNNGLFFSPNTKLGTTDVRSCNNILQYEGRIHTPIRATLRASLSSASCVQLMDIIWHERLFWALSNDCSYWCIIRALYLRPVSGSDSNNAPNS